jgi:hypothetical protein
LGLRDEATRGVVSLTAGLMIDIQDPRLDPLAIASATDCPVRARLATTPACPKTTSRRLRHSIPDRRLVAWRLLTESS